MCVLLSLLFSSLIDRWTSYWTFCKMLVFLLTEKYRLLTFLSTFTSVLIQKMTRVRSPFWPLTGQFMHHLLRYKTMLPSIFSTVKCGHFWTAYQPWQKILGLHCRPSQIQSARRHAMHSCPSVGAHLERSRKLKYRPFEQRHAALNMLLLMVVNSNLVSCCSYSEYFLIRMCTWAGWLNGVGI